jgi:large conductance mechanosensitive channel
MWVARLRAFLSDGPLGITIPVGVVGLWATWSFILALVGSFIYPVLAKFPGREATFTSDNRSPLGFDFLGIDFRPDTVITDAISIAILIAVLYWLFMRPLPWEDAQEDEMRDCPECKSAIFVDATRCAFCTAAVTPLESATDAG